jgi:hypothetical protein
MISLRYEDMAKAKTRGRLYQETFPYPHLYTGHEDFGTNKPNPHANTDTGRFISCNLVDILQTRTTVNYLARSMGVEAQSIWPYIRTFDCANIAQLRPVLLAALFDHLRWAEPAQFDILHQAMWSWKAKLDEDEEDGNSRIHEPDREKKELRKRRRWELTMDIIVNVDTLFACAWALRYHYYSYYEQPVSSMVDLR